MIINILTLLIALAISGVAGFFSIFGIALIFSGAFYSAIALGTALEIGKIISVSWLYRHWGIAPIALRIYLMLAILVLSLVTSLGVFGYLSRAHLEQTASIENGAIPQIELINTKIQQQKDDIIDVDKRVSLIDDALTQLTKSNKAQTSIKIGDQQRKNRQALIDQRNKDNGSINELQLSRTQLEMQNRKNELEVGPLRYITQLFTDVDDQKTLEKSVRYLIIIITTVFDPLAISLLIASNSGFVAYKKKKDFDANQISIDKRHIHEI